MSAEWVRASHKPNSVPAHPHEQADGNHLSRTRVAPRLKRPTRRLTGEQPAGAPRGCAIPSVRSCSKWGLPSQPVTWLLVSSYLTISPLPGIKRDEVHIMALYSGTGRYVSVALSLRSPSLDVIQHPALWSSDFPRVLQLAIACFTQTHRT